MATLITGGAGFVGLEVARQLLEGGEADITVFSRNPSPARLGDLAGRVNAVAGDVGNFSHVLDVVRATRPEVIYHLGAMLSVPSDADPASAIQTNAMGTFYVLEAARLFEARQVIFSSSIGTYGYDAGAEALTDTTLQRPTLFYGATKVFGEHMGLVYKRKYGLDFRGIRYPSVIGPGVTTPGIVQYTSWMIEESAKGNPFTVWTTLDTRVPVMYITETRPVKVNGFVIPYDFDDATHYRTAKIADTAASIVCRMDNGAVVKSLHGALRGHGNYVRIHGNRGLMENCRHGSKDRLRVWREPWEKAPGEPTEIVYQPDFPEHHDAASASGHGGGDFFTMFRFAEAIRSGSTPDFDVYRGVDMSIVGILAWRSALADSAPVDVPDLSDPRMRDRYRNDHWSPDPARARDGQPPSSLLGSIALDEATRQFADEVWSRSRE